LASIFPLPPFGRLALVQSLSSAGDAMVAVALANSVFFNVSEKAAQSDVALSLALTVAPFAVVGPLLGPLVERVRGGRRAIALAAALGRAGCCFFMAFWVHSLVLFPIAFFSLVFSKLWLVTKAALVPGTVDRQEQLVQANSKLSVGGSVAGMVAGTAGVGLLNLVGAAGLLRFDILVYLGCAIGAARLTSARRPGPVLASRTGSPPVDQTSGPLTAPPPLAGPPPAADPFAPPALTPVPPSSLPPTAGPPPYSGAQPALPPAPPRVPPEPRRGGLPPGGLQLAAVATAALRGSVGFVTFLLVFTFRHHGAALIWYGLALGASQVGNVTGALVAPRLRQRAPEEWMLTGSSVVVGGASLVAGIVHWGTHWPVAVLLAGGIGLAAGSGKVAFDSMVQRDVPSRIRARSFARFESGFQLAWALGSLLAVLVPMTLAAGFIAIGAVGLVGALAFAGGSIKARRGTLPAWFPGSAPRPTQPR
jgi:MFS family permease